MLQLYSMPPLRFSNAFWAAMHSSEASVFDLNSKSFCSQESSSVPFEEKADVSLLSSSGSHSASNDSFEHEIDFSPANQSLLQGETHNHGTQTVVHVARV